MFFSDPVNEVRHQGVLNVKSASLSELVEIKLEDVKDMLYKEYFTNGTKIYVFGVEYEVYEENKYYSSGVNYNFITLIKEKEILC